MNLSIFDVMYPKYKITKPIRLIECFAGYGSQALALKYLGVPFEHWRTCEWAIKSIQAYKDIHFTDKKTRNNYIGVSKETLVEMLYEKGISSNYNEPMTREQIERLSYEQLMNILNNIMITNNLVNIQQVKGKDLEIVDTDKYEYIMTYSFPCQDLSLAGKGKGMSDTSTRSGMLWEVERILTECKELGTMPQVLLMENVPQVHSVDNMPDFHKWQVRLEELGYKSYWQDLIATNYGIPQTRNRCFMVSILGDYSYTFPKPIPLKLKLKDMLEDNVDEKYYLSDSMIKYISANNEKWTGNNGEALINKTYASTSNTNEGSRRCDASNYISKEVGENYNLKPQKIGSLYEKRQTGSIYSENAMCPTLTTESSNNWNILLGTNDKLHIKNATKQGYLEATDGDGIDISSRMEHHRGNVQKDKIQTLTTSGGNDRGVVINPNIKNINNENETFSTLGTNCGSSTSAGGGVVLKNDLRIRKLTPRECGRLMNVKDEDITNMLRNQSDSSAFHLFGDSICTNVLMALFGELLDINWGTKLNELLESKGE